VEKEEEEREEIERKRKRSMEAVMHCGCVMKAMSIPIVLKLDIHWIFSTYSD